MSVQKQSDQELYEAGLRAARARPSDCQSVIVAPDHTGERNYHNCNNWKLHPGKDHVCGCGHTWDSFGNVKLRDFS